MIFEDQLAALAADSKKVGTRGGELDFALLVDGLSAEREQGITIDVAYRFFSTDKRKFIVADTPGHEQYTRNMVTGASTADLAVILIDARKGVLTQTRRHSYLVSLLGIRRVVLAVNKMDLVDYSQAGLRADRARLPRVRRPHRPRPTSRAFRCRRCTATTSSRRAPTMPWYDGPDAAASTSRACRSAMTSRRRPFRLPVQWVNRPDRRLPRLRGRRSSAAPCAWATRFGCCRRAARARVARIVVGDARSATARRRPVGHADAGRRSRREPRRRARGGRRAAGGRRSVRGDDRLDARAADAAGPVVSDEDRHADGDRDGRAAQVQGQRQHAGARRGQDSSSSTTSACAASSSTQPIVFEPYAENRDLGGFILIDRITNTTVGAGLLHFALRRSQNVHWQALDVNKQARAELKGQKPCVLWFTGLSGAGKSTIANLLEKRLHALGRHTYLLDGDNVRHGLNKDLGFTDADRVENIRRVAEVAQLMVDAGLIVLVSFISPFRAERRMARELRRAKASSSRSSSTRRSRWPRRAIRRACTRRRGAAS